MPYLPKNTDPTGAEWDPDNASLVRSKRQRDPQIIINLARKHTVAAMNVLIQLMNGKSGQTMTVVKGDSMMEVPMPVPPAVQLRAAEIVIERGYGKAPQAIMVKVEDERSGVHAVPIMERIAQLRAAAEEGSSTLDLEASQQSDPIEISVKTLPAPATRCALCKEPQFDTPSGLTCKNGHGGVASIPYQTSNPMDLV